MQGPIVCLDAALRRSRHRAPYWNSYVGTADSSSFRRGCPSSRSLPFLPLAHRLRRRHGARPEFDVVLGNPPWETMSPDNKEFFASYDPQVRFMSPSDQRAAFEHLLEDASVAALWDEHCRDLYAAVHFMKSSGRYRLFAPGNLGKGDFNVYRMFVESALTLTRPGQVAAQFVPEGLYNGANATAIRAELFDQRRLEKLAGFENTKGIWFSSIDADQVLPLRCLERWSNKTVWCGIQGEFSREVGQLLGGAGTQHSN